MLVAALLLAGSAAATTSVYVRAGPDGVTVHVHSDDVRVPRLDDGRDNQTQPPRASFDMKVHPPRQTVAPGANASFVVVLHASRDVTLDLSVANATRGFAASLSETRVTLAAGQNATLNLTVGAPHEETRGFVSLNATASDTGETRHAAAYVEVVEPRSELALRMDPRWQNGTAGESVTFRVLVGSSLARDVALNVTHLPPGWTAELERARVELGPREHAIVNLTVHVPANATSGGAVGVVAWTDRGERAWTEAYVVLPSDPRTMPHPSS